MSAYMDDLNVLAGDCMKHMPSLQENSVSLLLTDPPYFLDGMDNNWSHRELQERTKSGVVGSMPRGMKFDPAQGQKLHEFLLPVANECMRVMRPGAFALVFSQNRLAHRTTLAFEDAGFEIRDLLLWRYEGQAKAFSQNHFIRKRNIPSSEKKRLIEKIDDRKTPQLKPQGEAIVLAQAPKDGTFVDNWDKWETGLIDIKNPLIEPSKFPGTVIPSIKEKRMFGHMTVKPVELLRHLIRIFSKEHSIVLDPFMGSGSTGVAAILENRKFVGIELDNEMAECASSRIYQLARYNGD